MSKFAKGSIIRCIDDANVWAGLPVKLKAGQCYAVVESGTTYVKVEGIDYIFDANRFEKTSLSSSTRKTLTKLIAAQVHLSKSERNAMINEVWNA